MMPQNEKGSETEWICSWVPYADYPREREREREAEKYQSTIISKERKV